MSPRPLLATAALLLATAASAQLALPGGGGPGTGIVGDTLRGTQGLLGNIEDDLPLDQLDRLSPAQLADRLLSLRAQRIATLVRRNRDNIALDDRGNPATRGVVLVTGATPKDAETLRTAGYAPQAEQIEGLDFALLRIPLPAEADLAATIRKVRKLLPSAQVSGDTLYTASGAARDGSGKATLAPTGDAGSGAAGLIDGGVAAHPSFTRPIEQRGFARGAPSPSAHGTAVASLIAGAGAIKGAAPATPLLVADVYGSDPAGGGAFAIARALGWMAARKVRVVTVSLVGPDNPLLGGAVAAARAKGVQVVAAVGNDGPAAPPGYPASWPGVIAVTGIDRRDRVLPEAGRALHLDYAAPGADMRAAGLDGGAVAVRGTSFAAPLVAGRLYKLGSESALTAEARGVGKKAQGKAYGRGIVCGACRNE